MVAGETDFYTLNSLNSFLQKRTPIPGGLSQATVLINSFCLSFSKALLYSLEYDKLLSISSSASISSSMFTYRKQSSQCCPGRGRPA